MIKIFKDAFFITKDNLILLQPLILFLILLTFAVVPLQGLQNNPPAFYAVFVNIVLILIAFCCGWFGMIKQAIFNDKEGVSAHKNPKETMSLLKSFFPAVGQYFLSICLAAIIFVCITFGFSLLVLKLGTMIFSDIELVSDLFAQTMQPLAQQKLFISSLSQEQLLALNKWILYFGFWYFLFNILILYFPAVLFLKTRNPFKALWTSVLCVIKKPLKTICLCFYLMFLSFFVSAIGALDNINFIFSFIALFLTLICMTYYVTVIFLSYERLFNSNSGTDCDGKNGTIC